MRTAFRLFWVATLLTAVTASAHHSPAMFDQEKMLTLQGTVREFEWTNPHSYIQLVVKNDAGVEEEWSLEMGATMYLYNLGWRPSTVKPGDALTRLVRKDESTLGKAALGKLAAGRVPAAYAAYVDFSMLRRSETPAPALFVLGKKGSEAHLELELSAPACATVAESFGSP